MTIFLHLMVFEIVRSNPRLYIDETGQSMLSTPIKFGEETSEISFPATAGAAVVMAKRFCDERGPKAGIKAQDLNDMCVRPIGDLLVGILNKQLQNQQDIAADNSILEGQLDLSGTKVPFKLRVGIDSPSQMAMNICQEHKQHHKSKMEGPHAVEQCTTAVSAQFDELLRGHSAGNHYRKSKQPRIPIESAVKTVEIALEAGNFTVQYKPKAETASSAAKKFCVKHRSELGIKFTELTSKCIDIVQAALQQESADA